MNDSNQEPDINEIPEERDRDAELRSRVDFDTLLDMVGGRTRTILVLLRDGWDEDEIAERLGLPPLYVTVRLIPWLRKHLARQFAG